LVGVTVVNLAVQMAVYLVLMMVAVTENSMAEPSVYHWDAMKVAWKVDMSVAPKEHALDEMTVEWLDERWVENSVSSSAVLKERCWELHSAVLKVVLMGDLMAELTAALMGATMADLMVDQKAVTSAVEMVYLSAELLAAELAAR